MWLIDGITLKLHATQTIMNTRSFVAKWRYVVVKLLDMLPKQKKSHTEYR